MSELIPCIFCKQPFKPFRKSAKACSNKCSHANWLLHSPEVYRAYQRVYNHNLYTNSAEYREYHKAYYRKNRKKLLANAAAKRAEKRAEKKAAK